MTDLTDAAAHDSAPTLDLLLVEDDPADASLVKAAFSEAGVAAVVHHVVDSVDALARLRRPGARLPQLVLLDINLPRMTGRELLAALKADALLRGVPVVVLSTSDAESDVRAAYALGAAGYIVKPVDMGVLIEAMRCLHRYWAGVVRLPSLQWGR